MLLVAGAVCPRTAAAQTDGASLVAQLKTYHFTTDRTLLDSVIKWVTESRQNPATRRQAARELASVLQSDASFDAKQFACRQLVLIAGEAQIPVLEPLLRDDQLAQYALLILARMPGRAVDAALLRALPQSEGQARLAIIDVLGMRRVAAAIPALRGLLASADAAAGEAAASALARISGPAAGKALLEAFERASGDRRSALGQALLGYADGTRAAGDSASTRLAYDALNRDASDSALQAAALRGMVLAGGDQAAPRLIAALDENGTRQQAVAGMVLREIPQARLTEVARSLGKLQSQGQALLIAALSDRNDRSAAPEIAALCERASGATRLAALRALGALGDASSVPALIGAAASGPPEEREAARTSLVDLQGPGVDAKLLDSLGTAAPSVQAEAIRALGGRRVTSSVPKLVAAAREKDGQVSAAALRVLRDMGGQSELPALVDLALATPSGARDAAIDAVTQIARRGADEQQRTGVLLAKLSAATAPADRVDLLTILGQVGGEKALTAIRAGMGDSQPEVSTAALRLLAEWPTDEPMDSLLKTCRTSQDATQRALALRGYIRMIGANDQRPPDQALVLYKQAAELARSAGEKQLVLSGLAKVKSAEALDYAAGFLADSAVRPEAELAVVEIGRSTLGAFPEKTRAALEPIAQSSADADTRKRAADAIAMAGKFGDFVTAWEVSPAYQQDGANYAKLFDIAFPPEEPAHEKDVPWQLMPVGTNPDQPWLLDLLALWGGEQKVAYLRTAVWSESARDLVMESGSDDGTKAWWNGQIVLADNAQRAVAPGQDKVKLQAKAGWNRLLLKITQNVMGWGACVRFTNPDGSPATGLRFAVPSTSSGH